MAKILISSLLIHGLFASCSFLKLDKDKNCLNDKSSCFKADNTAPQFLQSIPASGAGAPFVSTVPEIQLIFSEELNNPQPSDFTVTGDDTGVTITSVEKIDKFTYRLSTNRNPVVGSVLALSFPNLKDYNGNKIVNGYASIPINLTIPILVDSVSRNALSGIAALPPAIPGVPDTTTSPAGYQTIAVSWHFNYSPVIAGNSIYTLRLSSAVDCASGSPLSPSATPAPSPAVGSVVTTYDGTAGTTYSFTLNKNDVPAGKTYLLICVTNTTNNKTGVQFVDVTNDSSIPTLSVTPVSGNFASAQTVTINCSDNSDRIAYTSDIRTDGSFPAAPATDPAFDPQSGVLTSGTAVSSNPFVMQTPYSADPTRSIFKYRCIDKAGNPSAVYTTGTFDINSSNPVINIVSLTKTAYVPVTAISGIGTGGHTSATITWNTNQQSALFEIRANGSACGTGGTQLIQGNAGVTGTPATAYTNMTYDLTLANLGTGSQVHTILLCVHNGTTWGQTNFPIIVEGVQPTATVNVPTGSYGSQQNIVISCGNYPDKIAYSMTTAPLGSAPPAPANPAFDAVGNITSGTLHDTPILAAAQTVTSLKWKCFNKAGRESVVGAATYTIDTILPTVVVANVQRTAVSNLGGAYPTTQITWSSDRAGLTYEVRNSGNCNGGPGAGGSATRYTGTTPAVGTNIVTTLSIAAGDFPTVGTTYAYKLCVFNAINNAGYQTSTLNITRDETNPVFPGPANITAVDATNFTLSFSAATDTNLAGYRVYRTLTSGTYPGYPATPDYIVASLPPTLTMPDLQPYFMRIVAYDIAGNTTIIGSGEIATKPTIRLIVAGLDTANAKTFNLTDGTASATISGNSIAPGAIWATTLAMGDTYNLAVTAQPAGQVCAIRQRQYGTLTADVTVNIDCVDGYQVAGRYQAPSALANRFMLYRGNLTTRASGQTNPNTPAIQGGFIYYGNYFDCDGSTAGNQHCIYRVGVSTGTTSSHVTGLAGVVRAIVSDGSNLYFATMSPDNRLYKVPSGSTTPIELASGFNNVYGLTLDGNAVLIANKDANEIRRFDLTNGNNSVVAGGLPAKPLSLAVVGNDLYFTTEGEHAVSRIPKTGGAITVVYGQTGTAGFQDNSGTSARFSQPHDLVYDGAENLYITEYTGHRIRRVNLTTNRVTTIAGDGTNASYSSGTGISAKIPSPVGLASDGRNLYFTTHAPGHNVVKLGNANLVAHWPLNAQPTDYANGALVTNFSLTQIGSFTHPNGRFNEANGSYRFDGSNYLEVADQNQYDLASAYTISVWINRNSSGGMRIIDKITANSCDGYNLDIMSDNRLRLLYCLVNAPGQDVISGSTIPVGQWVHVLATFSAIKQKARLYINGHLDAEKSTGAGVTLTNALSVRLGADHTAVPGPQAHFSGAMAEARLYSRVLSDAEINELAQDAASGFVGAGFNTGATELLTHLSFDPGVGAPSLADDGALSISMSTFNAPANGTGKDGDTLGAHILDGVTQYIGNTDGSQRGLPQGNAPRTVCAFFMPAALPAAGLKYMFAYGDSVAFDQAFGLAIARDGSTNYLSHVFGSGTIPDDHVYAYTAHINTWQHICAAYDGSVSYLYYNGRQVSTKARTLVTNSSNIYVGSFIGGVQNFAGQVDDVRVYNKMLSTNEIRQLATQIPAGLVARYDFTGDRDDMSGLGHHLANNASTFSTDRFGFANSAAGFGGAAHLVANATNFPLGNSSRTICAWTRPTNLFNGTFSEVAMYGTSGASTGWGFGMDASGGLPNGRIFILDTAGDAVYNRPHGLNIWRHVCATHDGTAEQLYVDGNSVVTKNLTLNTAAGSFFIGRGIFGPGDYFNGDIDEVRVYNRALSLSEIRTLQQQPNKRLQLSAPTVEGDMGGSPSGIVGADQRCPVGYKAMIVDGVNRRACTTANCSGGMNEHIDWVLRANVTYVTNTGLLRIFTADWNSVWNFAGAAPTGGNFSNEIFNSSQAAWTGLNTTWQVANGGSDYDCGDWGSALVGNSGSYGRTNGLGSNAIFNSTSTCNDSGNYLYCVQQ